LQRLQQVQQGHSTLLGVPHLAGANHKQFATQPQSSLLQQFNSQSSPVSPQVGLGPGVQSPAGATATSSSLQITMHQQSGQLSVGPKDTDAAHVKVEDQQQHQNPSDDLKTEPATNSGLSKNLMNEDDLKFSYAADTPVC